MKYEIRYQNAIDYCESIADGTHDSPKPSENGVGYPLITSKHLGNFSLDFSSTYKISEEDYKNIIKRSKVNQWDILFSMIGTVGRVYIERNKDQKYACKNVGIFRCGGDKEKALWLYYILNSEYGKRYVSKVLAGSTQSYISLKNLRNFPVPLLDAKTQQGIIETISAFDVKIEVNNRIISKLETFIQWAYSEKLSNLHDTKEAKLGDILTLRQEKIVAKDVGKLPYLPIDAIPCKSFAIESFRLSEEAKSSLIKFLKDDILIGAMRVYFHRVVPAPVNGVTRTTCMVLTPIEPEYFAFCLATCNQKSCIEYAQSISKGSTMPYAYWNKGLSEFKIKLPKRDDIVAFQTMILPMIRYIQSLAVQNNKLNEIRDILLPKLISGEVELKNGFNGIDYGK